MANGALTHALDLVTYAGKWATALGALYVVIEKLAKPYYVWRKKRLADEMREVLAPELTQAKMVAENVDLMVRQQRTVMRRQRAFYRELDALLTLDMDNRERHDETADLLNTVFHLSTDRRVDLEKRKMIDELVAELQERQTARALMTTSDHAVLLDDQADDDEGDDGDDEAAR